MDLARAYGVTVIDSTPFLKELRPYFRPDDPWHFAGSRQQDYGLAIKWQQIIQAVQGIARYVCMPDDLRFGLASVPSLHIDSGGEPGGSVRPLSVMVYSEPATTFSAAERFQISPMLVALMMEESLGFVHPYDLNIVQGNQLEPEGARYAGKTVAGSPGKADDPTSAERSFCQVRGSVTRCIMRYG